MTLISAPRQVEGVVGFFGAGDVPGSNKIGPVLHDEELFATRHVTCVGQARRPARHWCARGPCTALPVLLWCSALRSRIH